MLLLAAVGLPLPGTFLLIVLGSVTALGDLELWRVLLAATAAAIAGDQIGYAIGRFGGRRTIAAAGRGSGRANLIRRAEVFSTRWGGLAIFFSRWLVTALGPWVNLSSGVARYSWPRFLLWDVLGEVTWVTVYVGLGVLFSDRVRDLADLVGSVGWLLLALVVAVAAGWELMHEVRRHHALAR